MENIEALLSESNFNTAKKIIDLYNYNTGINHQDIIAAGYIIKELRELDKQEFHKTVKQVFEHLMSYPWGSFALTKLRRLKILDIIMPELAALENHMYGNFTLFDHTMRVLNEVERNADSPLCLKYAAIFHDIGKPDTYREGGGKPSFYGHEQRGAEIAWRFVTAYDLMNEDDMNEMYTIILAHMKPESLAGATDAGIQRFVERYQDSYYNIIMFAIYDKLATVRNIERCAHLKHVLERAYTYATSMRT